MNESVVASALMACAALLLLIPRHVRTTSKLHLPPRVQTISGLQ